MKRSCVVLVVGLSASLLVFAPGACAQPPPPAPVPVAPAGPSPEALAEAKRLFEDGVRAADASQWERAREEFLSAWRIRPHWKVAANLGRAEMKVGRNRDAAEHLTFFLREAPEVAPEDRRLTQQILDKAKARVGALRITVNLPGAEVLVGGQVVGRAPLADLVFVEPGQVVVEARMEGFSAAPVARIAAAGREEGVSLQLAKVASGVVGQKTGPTMVGTAGPLTVPVDIAGVDGNVAPPATAGRPGPSLSIVVTGTVLAGVALATGIGLLVSASLKGSNASQTAADITALGHDCVAGVADMRCDGLRSTAALGDAFNRAGIGLLVGAGVVGVGTIGYLLVPRTLTPASRAGAVRVLPLLSLGLSGLSVSGTY